MAQVRKKFVSKQPGKAIWTVAAAIVTVFQLLFWLIYFLPRRLRQHPQWTYRQAIMSRVVRTVLYHSSFVEVCTPVRLDERERFVTISPSPDHIYDGLLKDPAIRPSVTGGTWYPRSYETGDEDTVVLHFHGGAYATGEGRPSDIDFPATTLVKHLNAKALFLSYRLASNEGCHFPAALQEAVTAYRYLLNQGISPLRIVVSGDSAGGGLVTSLLRYIGNSKSQLPDPSAALLFSPWLDLQSARDPTYVTGNRNFETDYLPGNYTSWGACAYIPNYMDANDPYFSPLDHNFRTKTPLWIQVGGLEVLYEEGIKFADAMKRIGNKVEVYVEPLANHDILYVGNVTGFAAEAERAVKAARGFLSTIITD